MATINVSVETTNTISAVQDYFSEPQPIIDDEMRVWLESILNVPIFILAILSLVTNVINIRVFIQQGLSSDSNTVCLFGLALADLLGALFILPPALCETVKYTASDAVVQSCQTVTSYCFYSPHDGMARINNYITVYIAIERCLCVLIPFKVKTLLRPRVATTVLIILYTFQICTYGSYYFYANLSWQFNSELNATVATATENYTGKMIVKHMVFLFNSVLAPLSISIVTIMTGIMVFKLKRYKKWREKTAFAGKVQPEKEVESGPRKKDLEVLKLVLMVTSVYLVCQSMSLFPGIASLFVSGFSFSGHNRNMQSLLYTYKYLFDVINSSANFFFYVRISSRYRQAFNEVFKTKW